MSPSSSGVEWSVFYVLYVYYSFFVRRRFFPCFLMAFFPIQFYRTYAVNSVSIFFRWSRCLFSSILRYCFGSGFPLMNRDRIKEMFLILCSFFLNFSIDFGQRAIEREREWVFLVMDDTTSDL